MSEKVQSSPAPATAVQNVSYREAVPTKKSANQEERMRDTVAAARASTLLEGEVENHCKGNCTGMLRVRKVGKIGNH